MTRRGDSASSVVVLSPLSRGDVVSGPPVLPLPVASGSLPPAIMSGRNGRLSRPLFLFLGCALALAGSACQGRGRSADDRSKVHVGIVFDAGGKDDRSFNAAAWTGVKHAKKDFPIVVRDAEPGDPNSVEPAL